MMAPFACGTWAAFTVYAPFMATSMLCSTSIRQQVDGCAALDIDQNRAVDTPLLERKLIHPQHTRRREVWLSLTPKHAHNGVGAGANAKPAGEVGTSASTKSGAEVLECGGESSSTLRLGRQQVGETLGEGTP